MKPENTLQGEYQDGILEEAGVLVFAVHPVVIWEPLLVSRAHLRTLLKSLFYIFPLPRVEVIQDPGRNILLTIFFSWME